MSRVFSLYLFSLFFTISVCFEEEEKVSYFRRNLLFRPTTQVAVANHTKNEMAGTEAAVLIIVAIVLLSIIGMIIYFVRKFEQLNKYVPTYRYSSLKTEINGIYEPDEKTESHALVNVSTEEEDYDDDDDDEDDVCPPTLLVRSQQTVTSTNKMSNGTYSLNGNMTSSRIASKSDTTPDSDDELLQ